MLGPKSRCRAQLMKNNKNILPVWMALSSPVSIVGYLKVTEMLFSVKEFISLSKFPPLLPFKRNGRRFKATKARKPDVGEKSSQSEEPNSTLRIPKAFLARSAVAVACLGFIDAGYSGDWSRIGAISKETEDLLKIAAYLVVPLCLLLISSISDEERAG